MEELRCTGVVKQLCSSIFQHPRKPKACYIVTMCLQVPQTHLELTLQFPAAIKKYYLLEGLKIGFSLPAKKYSIVKKGQVG